MTLVESHRDVITRERDKLRFVYLMKYIQKEKKH